MFDDFDTQIQSDEFWPEIPEDGEYIDPDEYDDWCAFCTMMDMLDN